MLNKRVLGGILVLISISLLLTACGPSAEELLARDNARSAALAAQARVADLEEELLALPDAITAKEAEVAALEAELVQLQEEYYSLGGGSR